MTDSRKDKSRIPVIIGAAQFTQEKDVSQPLDPLGLMSRSGGLAMEDTGAPAIRGIIDTVCVISILCWSYKDAPLELANKLGLKPANKIYSKIGGNIPQTLVNKISRGIAPESRVYPMGGADFANIFYLSQRPSLHDSRPIKEAAASALTQAGLSLNDIDMFEIYSCFPCMIEIARREIGLAEDDPRELTVTGGLPFFVGPFNSYSLHAIATTVELIRHNPSLKIMVQANGGVNTNQSIGIYGAAPSPNPWMEQDNSTIQNDILKEALPEPVERANGNLTVQGYTILFNRQGKPEKGIALGRLDNGSRALAIIPGDEKILEDFEKIDLVGRSGQVSFDGTTGRNVLRLDSDG